MSSFPVHDDFLDELSCPICFEDFNEPKCLPGCAHNVCKSCLENIVHTQKMTEKGGSIECPVCREKALIPSGGIAKIPTNTLVVRMLERALVPRARQEVVDALERGKEKIRALQKSQILAETGVTVDDVQAKSKELKHRIEDKARDLEALIKSQEAALISQVNNFVKNFAAKDPISELNCFIKKLQLSVKQAEDVLKEPNSSKILQYKEDILMGLTKTSTCELNRPKAIPGFDLYFYPNDDLEQRLKTEFFGKLTKESEADSLTRCQGKTKILCSITADDIGETSFNPYTVAVSVEKGEMAVLDDDSNRVHILTEKGNYLRSFGVKYGDLYDVAFLHDKFLDGILVVNRSHNRLLAYRRLTGKYYPMFYATNQSIHSLVSKINFSSVTATSDGFLIVTSEGLDESCVVVLDVQNVRAQARKNFVFGKGYLACPRKTLSYGNEFFVCDRDDGLVKVFDARGIYRREIGEDLECPRGIVVDKSTGNILIADPGTDSIQAYKSWDGSFVGKINFDKTPISLGMNSDGNAVVCYYDSITPCVEILSFKF